MKRFPLILLIAGFLTFISYAHNDTQIDWADEGFLWLGASETESGAVPLRDFESYDPGRYYWCAFFFCLAGKGILALRLATTSFQFLGILSALFLFARFIKNPWALSACGLLVYFWMPVHFRYFDASIPIIGILLGTRLAEEPAPGRFFACGLWTALAFFFGINHGGYHLAGYLALVLYLVQKKTVHKPAEAAFGSMAGFGLGLVPLAALVLYIPGFQESYSDHWSRMAAALFGSGVNMPLPIPWPWTLRPASASPAGWLDFIHDAAVSAGFIGILLFYILSLPVVLRTTRSVLRQRALWISSFFVGLPYLHHVFSRPELLHLGEGIFPLVSVVLCLRFLFRPFHSGLYRFLVASLVVVSFVAGGMQSNLLIKNFAPKSNLIRYPVGEDRLWVHQQDASLIEGIKNAVAARVPENEPMLIAPFMTTFYPLLGKKSPVYELYFAFPQSEARQRLLIRQMEEAGVKWAILGDPWVDKRQDRRLSVTHPVFWDYLARNFECVSDQGIRPGYCLAERRSRL